MEVGGVLHDDVRGKLAQRVLRGESPDVCPHVLLAVDISLERLLAVRAHEGPFILKINILKTSVPL